MTSPDLLNYLHLPALISSVIAAECFCSFVLLYSETMLKLMQLWNLSRTAMSVVIMN